VRTCGKKKPEIQKQEGLPEEIHLSSVARRLYRSWTQDPRGFRDG
jgi:hypothetical protein